MDPRRLSFVQNSPLCKCTHARVHHVGRHKKFPFLRQRDLGCGHCECARYAPIGVSEAERIEMEMAEIVATMQEGQSDLERIRWWANRLSITLAIAIFVPVFMSWLTPELTGIAAVGAVMIALGNVGFAWGSCSVRLWSAQMAMQWTLMSCVVMLLAIGTSTGFSAWMIASLLILPAVAAVIMVFELRRADQLKVHLSEIFPGPDDCGG